MPQNFTRLNLPHVKLTLADTDKGLRVKCLVRKKLILLTPEEWVRQHFINFLNVELGWPLSLMMAEKEIRVNGLKKRFDIVCANNNGDLIMLIECKAADVLVGKNTFDQAARYNMALSVPYVVISNGIKHYCAKVNLDSKEIEYLKEIPAFSVV